MHLLNAIHPPIAMLHAVQDSGDDVLKNWCISQKRFLQLLDYLEENDYRTTHFAEINENQKPQGSKRRVILSFDDCYKHLLDFAVPELVKRGMKAVFYMPTAHIGGYNSWDVEKGGRKMALMSERDLKELVLLNMEVGSHSHHHVELGNLSQAEVIKEVSLSKQTLEGIVGAPVYSFAYPYGSVPENYKTLLQSAGYQNAVCIYHPFENKLALRRFGVYEKDTNESIARKLSGGYRWMRKLYDVVKKY